MTEGQSTARLDMGRVVTRTFSALGANFVRFALLALLFAVIPQVLASVGLGLAISGLVSSGVTFGSPLVTLLPLLLVIVTVIPTYVAIGAITHGAIVHLNGGRATFGDCLATGFGRFLPLILLALITVLGIALFTALLIIPGIVVATVWVVAGPALVVERLGVGGALGRSGQLTKNSRWRIFWLGLIYFVIAYLIGLFFNGLNRAMIVGDGGVSIPGAVFASLIGGVRTILGTIIGAAGVAALYFELRTMKEGATSEELAKVFE